MTDGERIKKIIKSKENIVNFCNRTGFPRGTLNDIFNKEVVKKTEIFKLILSEYKDVNIRWLLLGEGEEMFLPGKLSLLQKNDLSFLKNKVEKLEKDLITLKGQVLEINQKTFLQESATVLLDIINKAIAEREKNRNDENGK